MPTNNHLAVLGAHYAKNLQPAPNSAEIQNEVRNENSNPLISEDELALLTGFHYSRQATSMSHFSGHFAEKIQNKAEIAGVIKEFLESSYLEVSDKNLVFSMVSYALGKANTSSDDELNKIITEKKGKHVNNNYSPMQEGKTLTPQYYLFKESGAKHKAIIEHTFLVLLKRYFADKPNHPVHKVVTFDYASLGLMNNNLELADNTIKELKGLIEPNWQVGVLSKRKAGFADYPGLKSLDDILAKLDEDSSVASLLTEIAKDPMDNKDKHIIFRLFRNMNVELAKNPGTLSTIVAKQQPGEMGNHRHKTCIEHFTRKLFAIAHGEPTMTLEGKIPNVQRSIK